jgi:serine/threonine-protein kinase
MSPEQVSSRKDIDHRTDIWSLGVIACECLTGQRPFTAETLSELAMKIALGRADVPSSLGPVPLGFDAWFARATQVDPAQRFQSARELASALNGIAGKTSGTAPATARAELELAATLASASAGSQQAERSPQPELQATAVLVATHADAALSTTSTGASVPSRPGEMRGSRAWRRALWAGVPLGLGLLGATYSGLFEGPRAPSIRPGATSTQPAAKVDPPRPESVQPRDTPDGNDAGPPPTSQRSGPRAAKLAAEPAKTPRLRPVAPSSSTPRRTTAPRTQKSPRSTSDVRDAYDVQ